MQEFQGDVDNKAGVGESGCLPGGRLGIFLAGPRRRAVAAPARGVA